MCSFWYDSVCREIGAHQIRVPGEVIVRLAIDKEAYLRNVRQICVQGGADGKHCKSLRLKPGRMA